MSLSYIFGHLFDGIGIALMFYVLRIVVVCMFQIDLEGTTNMLDFKGCNMSGS